MITSTQFPFGTERLLNSKLDKGETLVWFGQPHPKFWNSVSIRTVLFGIPWTAFSVFWFVTTWGMTTAATRPSPWHFLVFLIPLYGLPFVVAGAWMLSFPYWMQKKAEKMVYAVTTKRALILEPKWRGRIAIRSISPAEMVGRTCASEPDGFGDLIFTRLTTVYHHIEGGSITQTVGFQDIPDVRAVDDLLRQTFG